MNDDLISRSWLLAQLDGLGDTRLIKRNFVSLVTNAPAVDAVPVVRCNECLLEGNCFAESHFRFAGIENQFCCAGKRKEGVDND